MLYYFSVYLEQWWGPFRLFRSHALLLAAGILLVREAGGTVTQLDGSPCALTQTDVIATNGLVHEAAVRALNSGRE